MQRLIFLNDPRELNETRYAATLGTISNFIFHFRKSLTAGTLFRVACPSLRTPEENVQSISKAVFSNLNNPQTLLKLLGDPTEQMNSMSMENVVECFQLALGWRPSATSDTPKKTTLDLSDLDTFHIIFIGSLPISDASINWNDNVIKKIDVVLQKCKLSARCYWIDSPNELNISAAHIEFIQSLQKLSIAYIPNNILSHDDTVDFEQLVNCADEILSILRENKGTENQRSAFSDVLKSNFLDSCFVSPQVFSLVQLEEVSKNSTVVTTETAPLLEKENAAEEPDPEEDENVLSFYQKALYGKISIDAFIVQFAELKTKLKANNRDHYMLDLCAEIIIKVFAEPQKVKEKWTRDLVSLIETLVSTPAYQLADTLKVPENWNDSATFLHPWARWLASGIRLEHSLTSHKSLAFYIASEMMCRELQLQLVLVLEVIRIVKYLSKSKNALLIQKLSGRFTDSKTMKNYILSLPDEIVDALAIKFALQINKEAADALKDVNYDGNAFHLNERDLVDKILNNSRYKNTIERICKNLTKKLAVNFFSPPKMKQKQKSRPKPHVQRSRFSSQPPTSDSNSQLPSNRQSLIEKLSTTAPLIQLPSSFQSSQQFSQQSHRSDPYSQSQPKIACSADEHIMKKSTSSSSSFLPTHKTPRIHDDNPFETPSTGTPIKLGHHLLSGTPSRSILSTKRTYLVMDTPAVERNRHAMNQLSLMTSPSVCSSMKKRHDDLHDDDVVMVPATPTPKAKKKRCL